jgi:tetratricopeptide (TPR) repeat protein
MTLVNNHIFKALDAYPYDLEEAIEALNYALAYDSKNTMALCLMGRIYAETLHDYEKAKAFYTEALAENVNAFHVYPHYLNLLLWNEDYEEAARFIDFALTVKGSDKAVLHYKKAILFEQQVRSKEALQHLKLAKRYTYNDNFMTDVNEAKSRIKDKMSKGKTSKNRKKKKR